MNQYDIYTELQKEDRKFGEKSSKAPVKDHKKRVKHVGQQDYSRMNPRDIVAMSDDYVDVDEEEFDMA